MLRLSRLLAISMTMVLLFTGCLKQAGVSIKESDIKLNSLEQVYHIDRKTFEAKESGSVHGTGASFRSKRVESPVSSKWNSPPPP